MNDELRTTLAQILKQMDQCMDEMDKASNLPHEGETLSTNNKKLARLLGVFGVHVAEVEQMCQMAEDYWDQLRHQKTLQNLETKMSVEKAKSLAKVDEDVKAALDELRQLEHSTNVLNRKMKSAYGYLDNSRSRLSFIGKDVHHGG